MRPRSSERIRPADPRSLYSRIRQTVNALPCLVVHCECWGSLLSGGALRPSQRRWGSLRCCRPRASAQHRLQSNPLRIKRFYRLFMNCCMYDCGAQVAVFLSGHNRPALRSPLSAFRGSNPCGAASTRSCSPLCPAVPERNLEHLCELSTCHVAGWSRCSSLVTY